MISGDSARIIEYLRKHPNFSFKSSQLACRLNLTSARTSKILLNLYQLEILERRCRRNSASLICRYKLKQGKGNRKGSSKGAQE